jgi:uncharacterized membrane protein (UPF0127 family)
VWCALLAAALAATFVSGCATWTGDEASSVDPALPSRAVRVGGEQWVVLIAPSDGSGMRGMADFHGADGMLFDLGRETHPSAVTFVMDGVTIPLDIAWFAASGEHLGTATMEPCPAEPCPRTAAPAPFRWAIEAPRGAFDGLSPGGRLEISQGVGSD